MRSPKDATVRIGGASGFWGDSEIGARQLVSSGQIDSLVFDYLAETTMAILASARLKRPEMGYATDFVDVVMKDVLKGVLDQGIRVVSNAGGINPQGCADALMRTARAQGLSPRIAVVEGDDLTGRIEEFRAAGTRDMFTGAELPARILSANAYLGAFPIARALDEGADIVITGRCVDSATTLGILIHRFGWTAEDFDQLASGSLAGHLLECGCQATGGLFTDWESVPDWPGIGYPIAECNADGSFSITKAAGTGGLIARAAVAEQLLYEIGDPGCYLLPDVSCDFRSVRIEQVDGEHVRVSGARGSAPASTYKVSATSLDGFRCAGSLVIVGIDAVAKARRTGEAIIERTRRMLEQRGWGDYSATRVEALGGETLYGPHSRGSAVREVMMRVVCDHPNAEALKLFSREIAPAGTSWAPGTGTPGGGRPTVSPHIRPFAFTVPREAVPATVVMDGKRIELAAARFAAATTAEARAATPAVASAPPPWHAPDEPTIELPLIRLAWARSGDKGDLSNIGVIARRPEWMPMLWTLLTPERVAAYFAHLVRGRVERFYLPGIEAMNIVMHEALDGGGPSSMRLDPLGKGMAQMLLDMRLPVPGTIAATI